MAIFEIPTVPSARKITTTMNGVDYQLTFKWCSDPAGGWIVDVADVSGDPLIGSVPLVTGADLLAQYGYMGFGVQLAVQTDSDFLATPTYSSLGSTSHLYLVTS